MAVDATAKNPYAPPVIDSHCHLADPKFAPDLQEVIWRAKDAGVTTMVSIADSLAEAKRCISIAEQHQGIYCTVGVHPHNAKEWRGGNDVEQFKHLLRVSPAVKAVGEIGLDYHYMNSPQDVQQAVFREQLLIAREYALPVVVHCREAIADVRAIVDELKPEKLVLHCCTEAWEDVKPLVDRGYMLSFTGIATYPSSDSIRMTIRECPLEQMMIETDAPYLAPVPHRGKRNEPAFVREVAKVVAGIKRKSIEEIDAITTANAMAFFGI